MTPEQFYMCIVAYLTQRRKTVEANLEQLLGNICTMQLIDSTKEHIETLDKEIKEASLMASLMAAQNTKQKLDADTWEEAYVQWRSIMKKGMESKD